MTIQERHLDTELTQIQDLILEMGSAVEAAIGESIHAFLDRELDRCQKVYDIERKIDNSHVKIDEKCVSLIARQSPVARDLRFVLAAIKINIDLERMGDQAVNIAQNVEYYLKDKDEKPVLDLSLMAKAVQNMVKTSLDAFVRGDAELAKTVIGLDDEVDRYKKKIIPDLIAEMKRDPNKVERDIELILIAKNLERLGDHATNIAEDVIYITSGADVRHGALKD